MRLQRSVLLIFSLFGISAARPLAAQDAQSRLWDAAIAGDTAAIRKAISEGARVDSLDTRNNRNGRLALNWAALNNQVAAIKLLLELKAPIEGENLTGFTALNHAAESGSIDAARALLAAGADPDHGNKMGYKPADTATERGHMELAKLIDAAPRKQKK
jgi:ankyrin repeat protein